jgi:hypothetical protein
MGSINDQDGISSQWDLGSGEDFHGNEDSLKDAEFGEGFNSFRQRRNNIVVEKKLDGRLHGSGFSVRSEDSVGVELVDSEYRTHAQISIIQGIDDGVIAQYYDDEGIMSDYSQEFGDDAVQNAVDWVAKKLNLADGPKQETVFGVPKNL